MITVEREPDCESGFDMELCCFCRKPTKFWYIKNDVACCMKCAEVANDEDVPTKDVWIRRETIAFHGLKRS